MALLTLKTTIFIEFENILFDTDTFVLRELYLQSKIDKSNLFPKLKELVDKHGLENIKFISQAKFNMNPLVDLLNPNIDNKIGVADDIYNEIIYGEYDNDDIFEDLELTNIGKSVHQLLVDSNLEKIYIYCKNPTDSIMNFLIKWLGHDDRIEYITGNKQNFLSTEFCTSYFISDYKDIEYIKEVVDENNDDVRRDIIVPEYRFNIDNDGKLNALSIQYSDLLDLCNINVNSAKIPIV